MKALLLALVALLALRQTAVADDPPAETTSPEGCQIVKLDIPSACMGRPIRAVVVLPPGYQASPDKSYPVLYALHGLGAPYTVWSDMAPLRAALRTQPMIVASFDGDHAGWYIDATQKPDSKFATFFFDEFMPAIEGRFRSSGVRGVTGFSMGGYGAMGYMLQRPELFASASALSGAFYTVFNSDGKSHPSLEPLLGPIDANRQAYEAIVLAPRLAAWVEQDRKLPPLMLHCGTEDHLVENNRRFRSFLVEQNECIRQRLQPQVADEPDPRQRERQLNRLLETRRIDFTYIESPGAHNWDFWRGVSADLIAWHWKHFQQAQPVPLKQVSP
ncbi:MAG: hypothetical protein GX591_12640 [Planctomycetes bacterium]|nr:hypothetical protein [Planctomycetota bacterium]